MKHDDCDGDEYTGDQNTLGEHNTLGNNNRLGNFNCLGDHNHLGIDNRLGNFNCLGDHNTLGNNNTLGNHTSVGANASLGSHNTLGNCTTIGDGFQHGPCLTVSGVKIRRLMTLGNVDGSGRGVLILAHTEGIRVEAGCFAGTLDEFCFKAELEGKKRYSRVVRAAAEAFVACLDEEGITGGWGESEQEATQDE